MKKRFPSFSQWKQIFKVLKKPERIILLVLFLVAALSLGFLITNLYLNSTKPAPGSGGSYIEGVVGQPRFINPIYGETNDIDRSLIDLVFSGLMTYDKDGKIVPDLADNYQVSDDGKTYDFTLKDNTFWHDRKPLTADDIVFTVKTIQNSDYKSPLRANWIDVDVQKVSDKVARFTLKSPYNSFLENCTLKIIPKHIWEDITPENFLLSSYNLQPVGSGLFKFTKLSQTSTGFIKELDFESNRRYYNRPSYLGDITFKFYEDKEGLVRAANSRLINGFSLASLDNDQAYAEKNIIQDWRNYEKFSVYNFSLPRYFAVFFSNQKASIFSDPNIRKAFTYAVNKDELLAKVKEKTKTNISLVNSPILPDFFGFQNPTNPYNLDIEKAKTLLDKAGFKDNGQGQREKAVAKKPAFQFKTYLKSGSKGTEVIQLQGCLSRLSDEFKNILVTETNGTYGKATEDAVTAFQKKYLPDKSPTGEVGQATRDELNKLCVPSQPNAQPLKFTLVTVNQPELVTLANLLKDYWRSVGAEVDIEAVALTDLKPIIKNRNYDALLYGQALGAEPDLYPFWHSSQKLDPGLNLSSYENKNVDQLLKEARETLDSSVKQQKLEKLQELILADDPAMFLYNPNYIYWVTKDMQGIDTTKIVDPAKRFSNIENWYIKEKRILK